MSGIRCAKCGNPNRIPTYPDEDSSLFSGSLSHLEGVGHEFVLPKEAEP